MNFRFTWDNRLHRKLEFSTVIQQGRRLSSSGVTVWIFQHPKSTAEPRLGFAVSRFYGNAVARNHLKRLLREIFRLNKPQLPPGVDMVFSARKLSFTLRYQTLEILVKGLWTKAGLWH